MTPRCLGNGVLRLMGASGKKLAPLSVPDYTGAVRTQHYRVGGVPNPTSGRCIMAGIFKAYDIRGVYGEVLNAAMGYQIGLAYSRLIGKDKKIACGRDGRSHSPELQEAFIKGVLEGGTHVVNMGLCTTPMTYFACFSDGYDGAVMITASHNPGKYNGLKFSRENAIPIGYAEGIDRIEAWVEAGGQPKAASAGKLTEADYKSRYLDFLCDRKQFKKTFKLAVDTANGMGGFLIEDCMERCGQDAVPLYWDLDFSFPNHEANPLDFTTLRVLQETVRTLGLDFGVAFDGDADRCFFVDDKGEVVPADMLTALIAADMLEKRGPSPIIYDIRSSKSVAEAIRARGGEPVLCKVGHSFMKAKLRELGGFFGGELAGHFYFQDFAYADSAFLTMITVMNIMDASGKSLSELIEPFQKYYPSGEINFQTDRADHFLDEAQTQFGKGQVLTIDGVRVDFADWWFSLRKSNTEPLLRLVVEGDRQDLLEKKVAAIKSWLTAGGAEVMSGHG